MVTAPSALPVLELLLHTAEGKVRKFDEFNSVDPSITSLDGFFDANRLLLFVIFETDCFDGACSCRDIFKRLSANRKYVAVM